MPYRSGRLATLNSTNEIQQHKKKKERSGAAFLRHKGKEISPSLQKTVWRSHKWCIALTQIRKNQTTSSKSVMGIGEVPGLQGTKSMIGAALSTFKRSKRSEWK